MEKGFQLRNYHIRRSSRPKDSTPIYPITKAENVIGGAGGVTRVTELPITGEEGKIYYNTTDKKYYLYDGTSYSPINTSKQDVIEDLETIRSGAAAGATALQKNDISVETQEDGTVDINIKDDTYTINLNHEHSQYLKYELLADEAAYNAISTKDSSTLYLIPES